MGILPEKIRNSKFNPWFQRFLRVLQFLSATISLGLFTSRLVKILRLSRKAYTASNGAVEGILCAAVLYTLMTMLIRCITKNGGGRIARWIQIFFDILFIGAFIAVADLTRPNGGSSGPCKSVYKKVIPKGSDCNLPWGTFILAIVST